MINIVIGISDEKDTIDDIMRLKVNINKKGTNVAKRTWIEFTLIKYKLLQMSKL